MSLEPETVDRIADLVRQAQASSNTTTKIAFSEEGREFEYRLDPTEHGRKLGDLVAPPRPATLAVTTLTGFREAVVHGGFNSADTLIHVQDYLTVGLVSRKTDDWGRRETFLQAKHDPIKAFEFDKFYEDPQRFIIGLQAQFLQTDDLLYIIRIASNMKAGRTVQTQDDGFTQSVVLRAGEVETAEVRVKPRVHLIPLRTFPEASEVRSECLLRLKETATGTPSIALFDVDGGKWKGDSMRSIKSWLEKQEELKGYPIVA